METGRGPAKQRILITGAAGLVGQNLVVRLREEPGIELVCIDKHAANCKIFRQLNPAIRLVEADLASNQERWIREFSGIDLVIMCHAQISSTNPQDFIDNNVVSTVNVLQAMNQHSVNKLIHISSSVVNSLANDDYSRTKAEQEDLVKASGQDFTVLRPTLMFGWFDRKHLGWLSRFMRRVPVFPIPGSGQYIRQPLYVGDFCDIIISLLDNPRTGSTFDITGLERVSYVDLMRLVRDQSGAKARIVHIPYRLFWRLIQVYGSIADNPPFTTDQLEALVIPEEFAVIDWPGIFDVQQTPLRDALHETFNHPEYSSIVLDF